MVKRNRAQSLESAIRTLKQFASKEAHEPVSYAGSLSVKDGQLIETPPSIVKKLIHLIAATFSSSARREQTAKSEQVFEVVSQAIDTIKKHHLVIAQLQQGNSQEQQFAESALSAIKQYNAALATSKKRSQSFSYQILRFLSKVLRGESSPPPKVHQIALPPQPLLTPELPSESPSSAAPLLTQEADALRMKTNILLKTHGIGLGSVSDAVSKVRTSPIHATMDAGSSTSTLCLTLNMLPGISIRVKGSFKRDQGSRPIADSFQLQFQSAHTGFPHPSQYTGWGLSDPMLPTYPHHLERLPLFEELYARKQRICNALMPGGSLLEKAQHLQSMKREAFEKHRELFLEQHRALLLAFLVRKKVKEVDEFMAHLGKDGCCLEEISLLWERANHYFMVRPHARLQRAWLDQDPALFLNRERGSEAARQLMEQEVASSEKEIRAYFEDPLQSELSLSSGALVLLLGARLREAGISIALQYWSETFECPALQLSEFELKLQLCSLIQIQAFFDELEDPSPSPSKIIDGFVAQMKADITILKSPRLRNIEHPTCAVVEELRKYYLPDSIRSFD